MEKYNIWKVKIMMGCETVLINGVYQAVCPTLLFYSGGIIGLIVGGAIGHLIGKHRAKKAIGGTNV